MSLEGVIAANRFGLGARPGEVARASSDPRGWLTAQIAPADMPEPLDGQALMSGGEAVLELTRYRQERRQMRADQADAEERKAFAQEQRRILVGEMAARFDLGFRSQRPFAERLTWFWTNHFTISTQNAGTASLAGAYEREAIRPHIAGRFEDMLLAMATHPAMLVYLNNAQSIGPHSQAGEKSQRGLNENFGRELMELYSLGVDGGYTQADVIALARLLTGWSIDNGQAGGRAGGGGGRFFRARMDSTETIQGASSGFRFFANRHEPGAVTLRGKAYSDGLQGGRQAIHDLAHDPATARFIAGKFAAHFISDNPPPASVARLEKIFRDTGGDLKAMTVAVVEDPAAWAPGPGKMRAPVEFVTASYRLLGLPRDQNRQRQAQAAMQACRMMGQFPMAAPSPKGWSDVSQDWSGPDAVLSRIAYARQLGARVGAGLSKNDVAGLAAQALGPRLSPATTRAMADAADSGEAVALLVSSPELQRR